MRRWTRHDRGVTTVEYALGVALIIVVSIGAISSIEDSGSDRLEQSGDRFEVADGAYYPGAPTTTTTPSGSTTSVVPLSVNPSSVTAAPPASDSGNKWIANASVVVSDSSGNPVSGAALSGTWVLNPGGPTETANCTTDNSGTCILQRTDINDSKSSAVVTITGITGPGLIWTPDVTDATTVTVNCPGTPSTCD